MDALSHLEERLTDLDELSTRITDGSFADQTLATVVARVLSQLKGCVADLVTALRELDGRVDALAK